MKVGLEVVGDGSSRRALEKLVGRVGLGGSLRLLREGDRKAVRVLLVRGDIFVNACPLESFGIAALEAGGAGFPVVARAQGGIGSFLEDGVDAILFDSDDAMAGALVRLGRDRELLQLVREGAAGGVSADFTWSGLADRYLDLYVEMLDVGVPASLCRGR